MNGQRNKTTYAYNTKNEKIKTIDAKNYEFEYVYDNMGNIIKEIYPDNSYKTYAYDLLNRPISKTNKLSQTEYLAYDANGNVERIADAKGNVSLFTYNDLNQQIAQINALNDRKSMTYDDRGNLIASIDFGGNLITFTYDNMNQKTSQTLQLEDKDATTTFIYDKLGRVESVTDPREYTIKYAYNIFNEKVKTTDALNNFSETFYDDLGRVDYAIDKKGVKTDFTYNVYNQKIKTVQAQGTKDETTTEFDYDLVGNLLYQDTKVVNPTANITSQQKVSYEYDELNRQTHTYINNELISSKEYDNVGNIAFTQDAKGNKTNFTFDANSNVLTKTDAKNNTIKYSYDGNSNLLSTTMPSGVVRVNKFDKLDRLVSSTIDKGTKEFEYDSNGNLVKEVDYNGNITLHSYKKGNRKESTTEAFGTKAQSSTYYSYDKNGNILSLKDENEKITSFEYDGLNREIKKIYPSSKYIEYTYDENSNQNSITKADGTLITQIYDNQNRIKTIKANGDAKQEFEYDTLSRLTYLKDTNEDDKEYVVRYKYDSKNNIVESNQDGKIIRKEYDKNSNLEYLNLTNEQVINYTYDKNNQIEKIKRGSSKDSLEEIVSQTYNGDNQLSTQTLIKSSISLSLNYDKVGREKTRTYLNSSDDIIYSSKINYDKNSNIIRNEESKKIASSNRSTLKEYLYDEKDQIKSYTKTDDIRTILQRNIYGYDKASNRVSNQIEKNLENSIKEILNVNEDNEYTSIKSNSKKLHIAYDENGNIIEYKDKKYSFDFLNRLVSLKDSNNQELARYYYDAQNRRVEKVVNNRTTTYLYHNNQVVQERVDNITTNTYYYSNYIDDPVAYSFNNELYYYIKDNNYSVVSIINRNANVVESYSYSPFGNITIKDQKGQVLSKTNYNNSITYTGRRLDSESNLYYYRNRMYNPELGRFLSKDPKGYVDGSNLYAYVKNNPVKYLDPMGTEKIKTTSLGLDSNSDEVRVMSNSSLNSPASSSDMVIFSTLVNRIDTGNSKLPGSTELYASSSMSSYFKGQITASDYGNAYSFLVPQEKRPADTNFNQYKNITESGGSTAEIRNQEPNYWRDDFIGQVISSTIGDTIAGFRDDRVNPLSRIQLTRGEALDARVLSLSSWLPASKAKNVASATGSAMSKLSQVYDDIGIKASLYLNTTAKQSINAGIKRNVDTFKSIGKVVDDTYSDMTIGAIKQANKLVPSSINNYLSKPSNVTNNLNDFIGSSLPGTTPSSSKWGARGFLGAYAYEKYRQSEEENKKDE